MQGLQLQQFMIMIIIDQVIMSSCDSHDDSHDEAMNVHHVNSMPSLVGLSRPWPINNNQGWRFSIIQKLY